MSDLSSEVENQCPHPEGKLVPYIDEFKYDICLACGRKQLVNTKARDLTTVSVGGEDRSEESREMREVSFEYVVSRNAPENVGPEMLEVGE